MGLVIGLELEIQRPTGGVRAARQTASASSPRASRETLLQGAARHATGPTQPDQFETSATPKRAPHGSSGGLERDSPQSLQEAARRPESRTLSAVLGPFASSRRHYVGPMATKAERYRADEQRENQLN